MKHTIKITAILLTMFLVTQFIGLYVVNQYLPETTSVYNPETGQTINQTTTNLPGFFDPKLQEQNDFWSVFPSIIFSFVIAIAILLILIKYKYKFILKAWFFVVVILALTLAINAFLLNFLNISWFIAVLIAIPLAYLKLFKPNIYSHNLTELLIYPGIAAVFIPILNIWTVILLLIIISLYDMWAVWHSKVMQKMAKFQMQELNIFGGFLIPYMTKQIKDKIKKMKLSKAKNKDKKIRVSLAILGGGDVVFPIITAGVFLKAFGIIPALFIIFGAFFGLLFLFAISEKKKFYPAMPFITAGIFAGLLLWFLLFVLI